jgi:hypothetical protein
MEILTRRITQGQWQAHLASNSKVWEAGTSEAEAVGKLIISAFDFNGLKVNHIVIERETKPRKRKNKVHFQFGYRNSAFCGIPSDKKVALTGWKERVTCENCRRQMKLHGHLLDAVEYAYATSVLGDDEFSGN